MGRTRWDTHMRTNAEFAFHTTPLRDRYVFTRQAARGDYMTVNSLQTEAARK